VNLHLTKALVAGFCLFLLGLVPTAWSQSTSPQFVFGADELNKNVSAFQINPSTGILTPVPGSPFSEGLDPCLLAVDPAAKFLFVANCSTNGVSVFQINSTTGALTLVPNSPFATGLGTGPFAMGTDSTGNFLYVVNKQMVSDSSSGEMDGYSINPASGALTPTPTTGYPGGVPTLSELIGAYFPPTVGFYIAENEPGDGILQSYSPDPATGQPLPGLSYNSGGSFYFKSITGDPTGGYLFAAGGELEGDFETFSGVTDIFSINGTQGLIVWVVAVDSTGSFLYTNLGTYLIDKTSGTFAQINTTEWNGPMVPDPLGPYMILAGVSIYQVDPITGNLTAISLNNDDDAAAVVITGEPPQNSSPTAAFSPAGLTFTSEYVGMKSATQMIQLVNNGTASLDITNISIGGADSGDFAETNNCPASLPAGSSCTIDVTFTPSAAGERTATIIATDNASGSPQAANLSGMGLAPAAAVTLSPASLAFPATGIGGRSASQISTVTNSGVATLTISSITLTGPNLGDFSERNTCGASVNAGASCSITVTFVPKAAGFRAADVSIADNVTGSPQIVALSGTGTSPLAATTTTLGSSANPSEFGQLVTFTATVTSGSGGTPTGTVTFKNASATLGSATLYAGGATFTTTGLTVGTHSITAVYGGDANHSDSTSTALSQIVSKATTTATLTSSQNPSTVGQSVTFTATITSSTSALPTGSVVFKSGTRSLGSAALSAGTAGISTTTLAKGSDVITVTYNGNADFTGSSATLTQQVN
jgi:hypothetical protein